MFIVPNAITLLFLGDILQKKVLKKQLVFNFRIIEIFRILFCIVLSYEI